MAALLRTLLPSLPVLIRLSAAHLNVRDRRQHVRSAFVRVIKKAQRENRLERQLQQLAYPKLLVLDEIGYLPMTREESSLFFRLVTRRYEKASTILTSNKSYADWGELFGDQVIATAILDRLLHHATTINIKGESYRLKEKRKAGLLKNQSTKEEN